MKPLAIDRGWGAWAAFMGMISVAGGAFGAHGLEQQGLAADQLANWHLAARYMAIHALALLATSVLMVGRVSRAMTVAPWAFGIGIFLFSGSLWAYVLSGQKVFAMMTPLGGTSLIVGWGCLAWALWKSVD